MKRTYHFIASRPGGFMNWPGRQISSNHDIRACVIWMFRKWFGRRPTKWWAKKGFMAQAWDERGNEVELHQVNHDHANRPARPAPLLLMERSTA